jgi:hypothetical protein
VRPLFELEWRDFGTGASFREMIRPIPPQAGWRRALLLTAAILLPGMLAAQLTTGIVEGTVRDRQGQPLSDALISVTGSLGFQAEIRTTADGEFAVVLPYGEYRFSAAESSVDVYVAPLGTTRVELVIEGTEQNAAHVPGLFIDTTCARTYPESISLHGILLSREPASVTEPLDFTGLNSYRLAVESQRAYSWTHTQFKLLGMDATDSYQPGRPMILPDPQSLDAIVVRSVFALTTSTSYGTEVGLFLSQPGALWHGTLSSTGTGRFLASSNLPPAPSRGMVQQAEYFRWFTRDNVQIGGPLAKWADLFASGTGQWSEQTVPQAAPGNDRRTSLLFGNARGRIRASRRDQVDAVFSGTRVNLSDWSIPEGLEALVARRNSPHFTLPGGFAGQSSRSDLNFFQAGWTRQLTGAGIMQVRYGYSTAHLHSDPPAEGIELRQSIIELVRGGVIGPPPITGLAVRTRQSIEGSWQPGALRVAGSRHQLSFGAGWKTSAPLNRVALPSDISLITANGAPARVAEFNSPIDTRSIVRSFSGYAADRVKLGGGLSLDVGALVDFSRGSLPQQASRPDLIAWSSVSPRAGFAWQAPGFDRLRLRGAYFRLYAPLAGRYLDFGNPNSLGGTEYQWMDHNSDGRFQIGEEGTLLMRFGGPYSSISPSLHRPYADEFNVGAEYRLAHRTFASIHLFRRDDKQRLAAINTGVPPQAFTPVTIADPGPDGIAGTFDDGELVVYEQDPRTLGQDQYLLTNPAGLRMLYTGLVAEAGAEWRSLMLRASFMATKAFGPTNPGDAVFENDPGVVGALFSDPTRRFTPEAGPLPIEVT